jgi:hypothetical protein
MEDSTTVNHGEAGARSTRAPKKKEAEEVYAKLDEMIESVSSSDEVTMRKGNVVANDVGASGSDIGKAGNAEASTSYNREDKIIYI